jgi:hypothetical protein
MVDVLFMSLKNIVYIMRLGTDFLSVLLKKIIPYAVVVFSVVHITMGDQ